MIRHPRGQEVIWKPYLSGQLNAHGVEVPGWEPPVVLQHVAVAPTTNMESADHRNGPFGVIQGLTLYLPAGVKVSAQDRFEVNGELYEVDGEAGEWRNPFRVHDPGSEVRLRRLGVRGAQSV